MPVSDTRGRGESIKAVIRRLRHDIVVGEYPPGGRLPTFEEMEQTFGASRGVLQRAVERLKHDGFIQSVNRRGLYVVDQPPHLYRYGLIFGPSPEDPTWSRYDSALVNEAQRLDRQHEHQSVVIYDGLLDPDRGAHVRARLAEDVRAHRLAGIILTPKVFKLVEEEPFLHADQPRVFLSAPGDNAAQTPSIRLDREDFYTRSLTWLRQRGRQRVAIIHMADTTWRLDHAALFAQANLHLHRPWIQYVGRSHPHFVEPLIPLLMDYTPEQRPDGLIIADDNLIEHASAALVASGIRVGEDIDVVAHCNWPWPLPSVLPLQRLGFKITDVLRHAVEAIALQRQGKKPPATQSLPALFETEVLSAEPDSTPNVLTHLAPEPK